MRDKKRKESDDVMHGRDFEGAEYAATEREQTEERASNPPEEDADEFVTDAEIEERERISEDDDG